MFDGAYTDRENVRNDDHANRASNRKESPSEEYRRLVCEATQTLSNVPGRRGRLLQMALTSGWS
jgi:hypothetical protein